MSQSGPLPVSVLLADTTGMVGKLKNLTPRQKEILRLLLKGFDAKSVGRELDISVHTVNEHLKEARRILGVSSSREAARVLVRAEEAPPNLVGPEGLGVARSFNQRSEPPQPKANRRLVYAGVITMILGFAVAIGLLTAPDGPHRTEIPAQIRSEENPSPYQYRTLSLGKFDQLKVAGPFQVFVFVGRESRVELQGPPELLADTVANVQGGTLNIRFREGAKWSWNPGSGMNVAVFTPQLSSARIEGAAQVEIHGATGEKFSAATEGSGGIVLHEVGARVVELSTAGAGGITAEGSALEATYIVGGSGSIDAKRMRVNKARITVNGSGESFADVSDSASVSVNGSGRIQVVGGANCVKRPPNSPRVECR